MSRLSGRIFRENRAVIILLILLALGNAAFFMTVVYPLQRRVATADQRAAAAIAALSGAEREHRMARETLTGKERAEQELRRFYQEILPADQTAARRITYLRLAALADEANLQSDHRTFDVNEVRDSSLNRMDIGMQLSGSYANVRRFIHDLEQAREFVVISGIEMTQAPHEEQALELNVRLATFYRATQDGQ